MAAAGVPRRAFLIDASPYVFRAYHALPPTITDRGGNPVHAVYGFTDFLHRFLRRARPRHVAVAFDESLDTCFRNALYPAYKANRVPPPAELVAQFRHCRRVARAMGLATFASRRFEADDLIAGLVRRLRRARMPVAIVTPDKDLAQLLQRGDLLWDYARDRRLGPSGVVSHFGVAPAAIADLLALAGDAVDNIPGVPGVGVKTAVQLLRRFGDLEGVYRNLDRIRAPQFRGAQALTERLRRHHELARLSLRLARLRAAPVRRTARDLAWAGVRRRALDRLLHELGVGVALRRRCARLPAARV